LNDIGLLTKDALGFITNVFALTLPGVKSGEPGSGLGSTSPEENIQSTRKPGYGLLQPYYSRRYPE